MDNDSMDNENNWKILNVFHKAAQTTCWYKKLLSNNGCDASAIKTTEEFMKLVPVLTKELIFKNYSFEKLAGYSLSAIHTIMLSSGQTGNFSLGIISRKEYRKLSVKTDDFLESLFGIKKDEALVINASAMGVRTFTSHTCCDTGPRADIAAELIRICSPHYKKSLIIGDPYMIKQIVEEAIDKGVDFSKLKIWFISGGDWLPETLRRYVHQLTGKSAEHPDEGYWSTIFGVTELGYPLFFETPELANLRATYAKECSLSALNLNYRMGKCTTPFLFSYSKEQLFVEEMINKDGVPLLVFTMLNPNRVVPMIRYKTGDVGELTNNLLPPDNESLFGLVVFWGRNNNSLSIGPDEVFINDIRELLFSNTRLACNITGYFTIENKNGKALLTIQLKKRGNLTPEMKDYFVDRLNSCYPVGMDVLFEAYHHFEQQMELDPERKFNHFK